MSKARRISAYIGLVVLFAIAMFNRIPYLSKYLYHWDCCIYEYGCKDYNVALHQPHPPGYFLYIALAKLLQPFLYFEHQCLLYLGVIFCGFSVIGLFFLFWEMESLIFGYLGAVLLITSPLVWFNSEVAFPYIVELPFILWFLHTSHRMLRGRSINPWLLGASLGLAAGVRQTAILFMAPMLVYTLIKLDNRRRLRAIASLVAVCLAWFIPMVALSGGFLDYLYSLGEQSDFVWSSTSLFFAGWRGITENMAILLQSFYGVSGYLVILSCIELAIMLFKRSKYRDTLRFIGLWVSLPLFWFLFVHINKPGYLLIVAPAVLYLGMRFILRVARIFSDDRIFCGAFMTIAVLFTSYLNVDSFLNSRSMLSRYEINKANATVRRFCDMVLERYSEDETIILGRGSYGLSWMHARAYLPAYRSMPLTPQVTRKGKIYKYAQGGKVYYQDKFRIPEGIKHAVLLTPAKQPLRTFEEYFDPATIAPRKGLYVIDDPINALRKIP